MADGREMPPVSPAAPTGAADAGARAGITDVLDELAAHVRGRRPGTRSAPPA